MTFTHTMLSLGDVQQMAVAYEKSGSCGLLDAGCTAIVVVLYILGGVAQW